MIITKNNLICILLFLPSSLLAQISFGFNSEFGRSFYRYKSNPLKFKGVLQDHNGGLGIDINYSLVKGTKHNFYIKHGVTNNFLIPNSKFRNFAKVHNLWYLTNGFKLVRKGEKLNKGLAINYEFLLNRNSQPLNFKVFYPTYREIELSFSKLFGGFQYSAFFDLSPQNSLRDVTTQVGVKTKFYYYGIRLRYDVFKFGVRKHKLQEVIIP